MERWKDKNNMVLINFYVPQEQADRLRTFCGLLGYSQTHILRKALLTELASMAQMYNEHSQKRKEMLENLDRCIEQAVPPSGFSDDEDDGEDWEW